MKKQYEKKEGTDEIIKAWINGQKMRIRHSCNRDDSVCFAAGYEEDDCE